MSTRIKKRAFVGSAIEIIGGLLVGALIIFFGVKLYAAVMGQGTEYFDNLNKEIESYLKLPEHDAKNTFPIVMDDGTTILGFGAGKGDITFMYAYKASWENWFGKNTFMTFYRPLICPMEKNCLCYCDGFERDAWIFSSNKYYSCSKPKCKKYDNVEFLQNNQCETWGGLCIYNMNQGNFALIKNIPVRWSPDAISDTTLDYKWQQVALDKRGSTLYICNNYPCIEESTLTELPKFTPLPGTYSDTSSDIDTIR